MEAEDGKGGIPEDVRHAWKYAAFPPPVNGSDEKAGGEAWRDPNEMELEEAPAAAPAVAVRASAATRVVLTGDDLPDDEDDDDEDDADTGVRKPPPQQQRAGTGDVQDDDLEEAMNQHGSSKTSSKFGPLSAHETPFLEAPLEPLPDALPSALTTPLKPGLVVRSTHADISAVVTALMPDTGVPDLGSVVALPSGVLLGRVDDVFGPVAQPLVTVRVMREGISLDVGAQLCLVEPLAKFVDPNKLDRVGTDASNKEDEEVAPGEDEDDDDDDDNNNNGEDGGDGNDGDAVPGQAFAVGQARPGGAKPRDRDRDRDRRNPRSKHPRKPRGGRGRGSGSGSAAMATATATAGAFAPHTNPPSWYPAPPPPAMSAYVPPPLLGTSTMTIPKAPPSNM